jgi:uncharacterized glyoxalase superfamily protein PhnB
MTQTVIPQLRITGAQRSLSYYVDGLGFSVDWKHQFEPGLPWFFRITRAGQTLFLTEDTGDCKVGAAVYFCVSDAAECHAQFTARGVVADGPPHSTPWGTLEFTLTDPDGNRLRFAHEQ